MLMLISVQEKGFRKGASWYNDDDDDDDDDDVIEDSNYKDILPWDPGSYRFYEAFNSCLNLM